jgi:predicted nucleic acid binding AN1-type Zn finger protein
MDDIDNKYNEKNTMITKSPKAKACENVLDSENNAMTPPSKSISLENRVKFVKVYRKKDKNKDMKKDKNKDKKHKKSKKKCNHKDGDCKCKTKLSLSMRSANVCVYCNTLFCNTHRLPENHNCKGDYKKIDVERFKKHSGLGGGVFKKVDKI